MYAMKPGCPTCVDCSSASVRSDAISSSGDTGALGTALVTARRTSATASLATEPVPVPETASASETSTGPRSRAHQGRRRGPPSATAARSRHPLVQARCARAEAALAECRGERAAALAAARRLASVAGATGLAEWSCEALALIARYERGAAAQAARAEALSLAHRRGFGWLVAALEGEPTRLQRGVG